MGGHVVTLAARRGLRLRLVRPCSRATPGSTRAPEPTAVPVRASDGESRATAQRPRLCPWIPARTVEGDLLRADLRGRTAYGAPQLDVPVA